MKKILPYLGLSLLALLTACPKKPAQPESRPDYEGVRQRSEESHKSLDSQRAP